MNVSRGAPYQPDEQSDAAPDRKQFPNWNPHFIGCQKQESPLGRTRPKGLLKKS